LPGKADIERRYKEITSSPDIPVDGVELNTETQLQLLRKFSSVSTDLKLNKLQTSGARYYYDNATFRLSDGIILASFLRHFNPNNIIEVGSGFSSALMLDLLDTGLQSSLLFIEPYPDTLNRLMRDSDKNQCRVLIEKVQDVSLDEFKILGTNDILFIDTSHVMKIGSDLSRLFYSVLPQLKAGVIVHIHDVFWPFEYPENMIREGRVWNEIYFVRSFLQFNEQFEILYFSSFMESQYPDTLTECLPNYSEFSGASLWLRRKT
jgi:predicted O-methyltransferase YrrM